MPERDASATEEDLERGRTALLDITAASTIGEPIGSEDLGDGVTSVFFAVTMPGYPGWRWTATIAHVEGVEPSVLETEMTPGEGALLAPDWVPWVDRLAEYHAAQEAAASDGEGDDDADDDEPDDGETDDDGADDGDDEEDEVRSRLHSGDLDGVDIDSLDDDADDEGIEDESDAEGDEGADEPDADQ